MLRTIGKQSGESVKSVLKKKRKAMMGRTRRKGRFYAWTDGRWEWCESMKPMEEVPVIGLGVSELERSVRGWRREAGSWFQRRGEACWKELSVIHREDDVDGLLRKTSPNSRNHRTSLPVSLPVLNPAVHVLFLQQLHWIPIKHRIDFKIANITFRTLLCSQPAYLRSSLHACHSTRSLRLSSTNLLCAPFIRTSFGSRSFSVAAPKIWKSQPYSRVGRSD